MRESVEEALARSSLFDTDVNKATHCVLAVTFSPLDTQYFTTTASNETNRFRPFLYKRDFSGSVDWGCWHFLRDLPLRAMDASGNMLLETEWLEIM